MYIRNNCHIDNLPPADADPGQSPAPSNIASLAHEQFQKEQPTTISTHHRELPQFVNLADPQVLGTHLGPHCQEFEKALALAKIFYERPARPIANSKYGFAFPMTPEVLAYAMERAKNEIVLEVAGASGENAIMLAFAGAKKVYMNDIEPTEMRAFRGLMEQLPDSVKERLQPVEGSCFDLLKAMPDASNKVGLILCRNLIHFFTNQQQADFFQILKTLLKPDGTAIFLVNSKYAVPENESIYKASPHATSFTTTHCLVTDYEQGTMPCAVLHRESSVAEDSLVASEFTNQYLYERNVKTGLKWKVYNDEFHKLPAPMRTKIKDALAASKTQIARIRQGNVRVLTSTFRLYDEGNLNTLFASHGFAIESTFVVGENGHLVPDADRLENGRHVGVIVRRSAEA